VNRLGGKYHDSAGGITLDSDGRPHVTGQFQRTVDFEPGAGETKLTAAGGIPIRSDVFVARYTSSGDLDWATRAGANERDVGNSIAVDPAGNVLVVGVFDGTVDFDPGAGVATETSAGGSDVFVWKLNPLGEFEWVRTAGWISFDSGNDVVVDQGGRVVVVGSWEGTFDFDPGPEEANLTPAGRFDMFVWSFTSEGKFEWARSFGGPQFDGGTGVAIDAQGSVFAVGSYMHDITGAEHDAFLARMDRVGNVIWTLRIGGYQDDDAYGVETGPNGSILVSGSFQGNVDFDPGPGEVKLKAVGTAGFILRILAPTPVCHGRLASIIGSDGSDDLLGTARADVIVGGDGADQIDAKGGRDRICGGGGSDEIFGGAGRDRIWGEGGKDLLHGGPGKDALRGGKRDDTLEGEGGDDKLFGNNGVDSLDGGDGSGDLCVGEILSNCEI
jgi:Ca2+-binding RTX toxin-like protein